MNPLSMASKSTITGAIVALAYLTLPKLALAQQQELRDMLFAPTDSLLAVARQERADVLAPNAYQEGMKRYREAEQDLERGRNIEDIRNKLRAAGQYFEQALEATKLGDVTLAAPLAARDDAEEAEAPKSVPELWKKAEDKFREAATRLERGDVNEARKRGGEAETLFREAELEAIKRNYLQETWDLLRQARQMDVDDRAPKTLARAEELANQAEQLLSESRYDTDQPRAVAQQAKSEAMHAIYLAGIVSDIRDDDMSIEDAMLAAENQMRTIAGALDVVATFETGMDETTQAIVAQIETYEDSIARLELAVANTKEQLQSNEARVAELEEQLGGVAQERTELVQRMEAQAEVRQRFATVDRMFDRDEARVLRDGDDLIIRLVGLTFPVGSATIAPENFALLTHVQQAIAVFPESRITVEGHTDSFGGDEQNLQLSQERADAVRSYLLANMQLDPSLIDAVGFGEAQPVASNETAEGRARNRRTDVVIHTGIGM